MERYIDANKIPYFNYSDDNTATEGVDYTLKGVIENRVPTEDVRPERYGEWIQVDDNKCKCSKCDIIALIALYPHGDKNFCPNCGAKMTKTTVTERI